MQDFFVTFFLMLATAPCLRASDGFDNSQFEYDYESLKMVGLIIAGILCAMGIIILLSGKCRCKFNKKSEQRHRAQEQQLITPGNSIHMEYAPSFLHPDPTASTPSMVVLFTLLQCKDISLQSESRAVHRDGFPSRRV